MAVRGVLWDVGNVIVRWDPRTLYSKVFDDPAERDAFLAEVCPMSWHAQIDAGKPFDVAVAERTALFPRYAREIGFWHSRFMEMVSGPIDETEAAIAALAARGLRQIALTNMSAEIWTLMDPISPAFALLDDAVVSGAERVIKPDPAIFEIAAARAGLPADALLFVDDSAANIAAADALGFDTHHFTDPAALEPALKSRGLL